MEIDVSLDAPSTVARLFAVVSDLATYPSWLDVVHSVSKEDQPVDGRCGWQVELRGKVGPFARSKRLRMVQTAIAEPNLVRFERLELDGRKHSPWILTAKTEASGSNSTLSVHLHYGGSLFSGRPLEHLLADQIERGRERLVEILRTT